MNRLMMQVKKIKMSKKGGVKASNGMAAPPPRKKNRMPPFLTTPLPWRTIPELEHAN